MVLGVDHVLCGSAVCGCFVGSLSTQVSRVSIYQLNLITSKVKGVASDRDKDQNHLGVKKLKNLLTTKP